MKRRALGLVIVLAFAGALLALGIGQPVAQAQDAVRESVQGQPETAEQAFLVLFEKSMAEGKGLVLHVNGQAISGAVVRVIGDDAVEVRNREHSHVIVRLERIDAVAAN